MFLAAVIINSDQDLSRYCLSVWFGLFTSRFFFLPPASLRFQLVRWWAQNQNRSQGGSDVASEVLEAFTQEREAKSAAQWKLSTALSRGEAEPLHLGAALTLLSIPHILTARRLLWAGLGPMGQGGKKRVCNL